MNCRSISQHLLLGAVVHAQRLPKDKDAQAPLCDLSTLTLIQFAAMTSNYGINSKLDEDPDDSSIDTAITPPKPSLT